MKGMIYLKKTIQRNPATQPPKPEKLPSSDSRVGHGLSETEVLKSKR